LKITLRKIVYKKTSNYFNVILNDIVYCWHYIISATGEGWAWSVGGIKLTEEALPI